MLSKITKAPTKKASPKAKAKPQSKKASSVDAINMLCGCMGKKLKRPIAKDEISYVFIEMNEGGIPMFQATVASSEFEKEATYTGKAAASQGDAKRAAAKAAIVAEFPESKQATPININADAKSKLCNAAQLDLGTATD
jgi:hypothetical protein